jgi:ankyrin repeat protein
VDVAKLIIAKGAEVNAKSQEGYTPLDIATRVWRSTCRDHPRPESEPGQRAHLLPAYFTELDSFRSGVGESGWAPGYN